MSAGLAASTVTPGSTAPDVSLTVPAMLACAKAVAGIDEKKRIQGANRVSFAGARICPPFPDGVVPKSRRIDSRERRAGMIRQRSCFVDRGRGTYTAQIGMTELTRSVRALSLVCLCVLLLTPRAEAGRRRLFADFDADGRRDRVTLDAHEPWIVRIWLSATRSTHIIRSAQPLRAITAVDLNGDRRPELIFSN